MPLTLCGVLGLAAVVLFLVTVNRLDPAHTETLSATGDRDTEQMFLGEPAPAGLRF